MAANGIAVRMWEEFALELKAPEVLARVSNPFVDVTLEAEFRCGPVSVRATGFYDGDGVWRVRCMPSRTGVWSYRTRSNIRALSAKTGSFKCTPASSTVHGPVRVAHGVHLAYADGTPYVACGTTAYGWMNQPMERVKQTLSTLRAHDFNKIRCCVFPKEYDYNHDDPPMFAFERRSDGSFDLTRPNPAFFRHLEWCIRRLGTMGIECDLILFHPYDRWGFQSMPADADDRYLTYVVARLASLRNVWWSLANEFDFMRHKCDHDFYRYLSIITRHDPYNHLCGNHNGTRMFDHSHARITHVSLQWQQDDYGEVRRLRDTFRKPVVLDESGYEGDINHGWGCLSAGEVVHRALMTIVLGGHAAGHGETYWNSREVLWWGKGGVLTGSSPAQLAFVRTVLARLAWPLEPAPDLSSWDRWAIADSARSCALLYFGRKQPAFVWLNLPKARRYRAELLDTRTCRVTKVKGTFSGWCRVGLLGREGQLLVLRAI